jgi:hypothetical protein
MTSSRTGDRLVGAVVGAVVTVLVLTLVVVVLLWRAGEPVDAGEPPRGLQGPATGADVDERPPADLGPEESWFGRARLDAASVVLPGSALRDVRAVGSGVRSGPGGTTAARLDVTALVPFEVVAAEVGEDVVLSAADDGLARVETPVDALGRQWQVTATGTVDVSSGRIVLRPLEVDVEGLGVLGPGLDALARQAGSFEHEVAGLPEGLVLQEVTVVEDGFRAELAGEDVVLVP